jgi:hypothetical protein
MAPLAPTKMHALPTETAGFVTQEPYIRVLEQPKQSPPLSFSSCFPLHSPRLSAIKHHSSHHHHMHAWICPCSPLHKIWYDIYQSTKYPPTSSLESQVVECMPSFRVWRVSDGPEPTKDIPRYRDLSWEDQPLPLQTRISGIISAEEGRKIIRAMLVGG